MSLSAVKFRQRNRVVKLSKEPLSEVSSVLEHAPPQDKGDIMSLEKRKMSMPCQVNKDVQQPKMLDYMMTKLFLWTLR